MGEWRLKTNNVKVQNNQNDWLSRRNLFPSSSLSLIIDYTILSLKLISKLVDLIFLGKKTV